MSDAQLDINALARVVAERVKAEFVAFAAGEHLLTREQLAVALNVSLASIKRYRLAGMPVHILGDRQPRYRLSECLKWHEERARQPSAAPRAPMQHGVRRISRVK